MKSKIWRQGDVVIIAMAKLPDGVEQKADNVLAEGEATGHAHRIKDPSTAKLFVAPQGLLFVNVNAPTATITHEEHADITLPRGVFEIKIQREYDWFNEEVRSVVD